MLWRLTILSLLLASTAAAQSESPRQVLQQAIQAQESGHYAEAIADYQRILKAFPGAAPVRSNLGAALVHEGRYKEAIQQYRLALKDDPSNYGIRLNLGLAYYKSDDIPHATSEFEAVYAAQSANDVNHRQLSLLLAECYLREGKNKRVIAVLGSLEPQDPNDSALEYLLGTALLHNGQTHQGTLLIQKLFKDGDPADAHMLLAYTLYAAHNKDKALVEVKRAIALKPNLPEAYSLLGRLQYLESHMKAAEAGFEKALQLDPNNFDARLWLGTLQREEGQYKAADVNLKRALQLQPNSIRARYQYARECSDQGEYQRAAKLLEALVKFDPGYTEAHRTLATIYFRLGRTADGRRETAIVQKMDAAIQARELKEGQKLK